MPKLDPLVAKKTFAAIHFAIHAGLVRSCHDLSEGGLAVAVAEMAFAGGLGAENRIEQAMRCEDDVGAGTRILRCRKTIQRVEHAVSL